MVGKLRLNTLFMLFREPVNFGNILPLYNFALVMLNYYILQEVLTGSFNANYTFVCTPLRKESTDENELKVSIVYVI